VAHSVRAMNATSSCWTSSRWGPAIGRLHPSKFTRRHMVPRYTRNRNWSQATTTPCGSAEYP